MPGCQVALRSSAADALGRGSGAAAFHTGSDLHTDKEDGTFSLGTCAAYACWPEDASGAGWVELDHPNPFSDVAVFPTSHGGVSGVRWQTMHPEYFCILLMHTAASLHGSVFPDDAADAATRLPVGMQTVRAIFYPLKHLQIAAQCLRADPEALPVLVEALADQGPQSARILARLRAAAVARGLAI